MHVLAGIVKWADRATGSWSTRIAVNHLVLKRYGTMTHLSIDSVAKTMDVELQLIGEELPVKVHVGRYVFERFADGEGTLVVSGVTVSRGWMQELAKNFVEGKPHVVPAGVAGYLGMVL